MYKVGSQSLKIKKKEAKIISIINVKKKIEKAILLKVLAKST